VHSVLAEGRASQHLAGGPTPLVTPLVTRQPIHCLACNNPLRRSSMNRPLTALLAIAFIGFFGPARATDPAAPSVASKALTRVGAAIKKGATKTGEVVGTTVERTAEGVEKGFGKGARKIERGAKKANAAVMSVFGAN
jgi:hypothetical protein